MRETSFVFAQLFPVTCFTGEGTRWTSISQLYALLYDTLTWVLIEIIKQYSHIIIRPQSCSVISFWLNCSIYIWILSVSYVKLSVCLKWARIGNKDIVLYCIVLFYTMCFNYEWICCCIVSMSFGALNWNKELWTLNFVRNIRKEFVLSLSKIKIII